MLNSLKLNIEFERMMDEKFTYLIIKDDEDNTKFVLTGEGAANAATKIEEVLNKIYRGEEA
jgi:hypothetical protein